MQNKLGIGLLVIGMFLIFGIGIVSSADSYRLNAGNTVIISEHYVAKKVTNNLASDIFIPTRSSTEWASFRANTPTSVSVVDGCLYGSDCASGTYCTSSTNTCVGLPAYMCVKAATTTGYTYQSSNQDIDNQCSTTGCGTGYCSGISYSCGFYKDGLQHNCAVNYICNGVGTCELDGCTYDSDCGFGEYCNMAGDCMDCSVSDLCRFDEKWDPVRCECVLACFIGKTQVLMADGTYKRIDEVQVGEVVQGEYEINEIKEIKIHDFNGKLYSINGGDYFVTEEHPFKSLSGWKAINPMKLYEEEESLFRLLDPKVLKVGDILFTEDGLVVVESIDSKKVEEEIKVYNLKLGNDHLYYADGYLVHNLKEPI